MEKNIRVLQHLAIFRQCSYINFKINYQLLKIEGDIPLFQPLQYYVQEHLKGNEYFRVS